MFLNKIKEAIGWQKDDTEKLKEFANDIDFKVQKKRIKDKLKESTIGAWTLTFTKTWVRNLMILSCSWISRTYILSLIGDSTGSTPSFTCTSLVATYQSQY